MSASIPPSLPSLPHLSFLPPNDQALPAPNYGEGMYALTLNLNQRLLVPLAI